MVSFEGPYGFTALTHIFKSSACCLSGHKRDAALFSFLGLLIVLSLASLCRSLVGRSVCHFADVSDLNSYSICCDSHCIHKCVTDSRSQGKNRQPEVLGYTSGSGAYRFTWAIDDERVDDQR